MKVGNFSIILNPDENIVPVQLRTMKIRVRQVGSEYWISEMLREILIYVKYLKL